jgi:outer membrane protein TolC
MGFNFLITAMALLVPSVWAFGPKEALLYQSAELGAARASLQAAQGGLLAANLGLGANFSAERSGAWDGLANNYAASLQWQWDGLKRLQAGQAVERAQREIERVRREGVKGALLAHANLWAAQNRFRAAELRLQAAKGRTAEIERKAALGAISALQTEEAQLSLKQSELGVRQAQSGLSAARAEARRYGLAGEAEAEVLRFATTNIAADQTPTFLETQSALALSEARLSDARSKVFPRLSLGAGFVGRDLAFSTGISNTGLSFNPTASLGLDTSQRLSSALIAAGAKEEWRFSLKAEVPLSLEVVSGLQSLEAEREGAAVRLSKTLDELRLRLEQLKGEAAAAGENLELAQLRRDLAVRQTRVVQAKAQAGSASVLDVLEAQANEADVESQVAIAWQGYVNAVAAHLDLAGGEWRIE